MDRIRLPHVTEIIGAVATHWHNFDAVAPERLAVAQERGTNFHSLAAAYALGLWADAAPENCTGFFQSFRDWFDAHVEVVVLAEQRLIHSTLHFTGSEDLICRIKGDKVLTLIDHKTPRAFSKTWRLQLAAYKELADKNGLHVGRVASLQPHPGGGQAKFVDYTKSLTPDFARFMAALTIWNYFEEG